MHEFTERKNAMFKYDFFRAKSVEDACSLLERYGEKSRVVAGGTDLLVQIRDKDPRWKDIEAVIDITGLHSQLGLIAEDGGDILIGALATHTEIENDLLVRKHLSFLSEACSTVGSPQIRNRGTIGGSICNASPAADPLTPLIAADAVVQIQGSQKIREIKLSEFYHGKGSTDLAPGEFVRAFKVRKSVEHEGSAFVKLGRRKALAISRLNAAVRLKLKDGCIVEAAIAPGCIFTVPERVKKAEELLIGEKPSETLFQAAGEAVSAEMIERTGIRWSTEYKKPAVETIVADAIQNAVRKQILIQN